MLDFNSVLDGARAAFYRRTVALNRCLVGFGACGSDAAASRRAEATLPLHGDWALELERRVAAIRAGSAQTVPWTTIRDERWIASVMADSLRQFGYNVGMTVPHAFNGRTTP